MSKFPNQQLLRLYCEMLIRFAERTSVAPGPQFNALCDRIEGCLAELEREPIAVLGPMPGSLPVNKPQGFWTRIRLLRRAW